MFDSVFDSEETSKHRFQTSPNYHLKFVFESHAKRNTQMRSTLVARAQLTDTARMGLLSGISLSRCQLPSPVSPVIPPDHWDGSSLDPLHFFL